LLLENIIKEYIYEIKCRNYTERTIKGYKNNLNRWCVYFNNELNISRLEEGNHIHIKKYPSFLKSKGLSESYILRNMITLLRLNSIIYIGGVQL